MRARTDLLANLLGQGWTTLLNIGAVPFYIRLLGIEAFGLIGLYTVVLATVTLLDAGMATTVNREMVRYRAGERSAEDTRDLLRSVELMLGGAGLLLALVGVAAGPFLARIWIAPSAVPLAVVALSLSMMIAASVLRVLEAIYRGALLGLGRTVLMNALSIASTTLRIVGVFGAFALFSADLRTFFLWQVAACCLTLFAFAITAHRSIGVAMRPTRFAPARLREVRDFAGGAFWIAALGVGLTQVDKIVAARLVPLGAFGHYAAATVIATGVYQLVLPAFHSFYPRLSHLHVTADLSGFRVTYLGAARLLAVLAGVPVAIIVCFGQEVLFAWTADAALAAAAAPLLQLLAVGTLAYGLYHLPLAALLAAGVPRVAVRVVGGALLLVLPAIGGGFALAGLAGVAAGWAVVLVGTLAAILAATRRAVLPSVGRGELARASLGPVALALGLSAVASLAPVSTLGGPVAVAAGVAVIGVAVLAATAALTWPGAVVARLVPSRRPA